jgi:hypothetical protein
MVSSQNTFNAPLVKTKSLPPVLFISLFTNMCYQDRSLATLIYIVILQKGGLLNAFAQKYILERFSLFNT